jgi:hypothetical protein
MRAGEVRSGLADIGAKKVDVWVDMTSGLWTFHIWGSLDTRSHIETEPEASATKIKGILKHPSGFYWSATEPSPNTYSGRFVGL